jgi:hypothetical protein
LVGDEAGGVSFGKRYESVDPDAPELYIYPERFTKQPYLEKLDISLRVLLLSHYDNVIIKCVPHEFASLLKRLNDYRTWTVHCDRLKPLPLSTDMNPKFWRAKVREWFLYWGYKNDVAVDSFKVYGKLRKNPTFTFDTFRINQILPGSSIKEDTADDEQMTPDQAVRDLVGKIGWKDDLHQALWYFHPYGVSYSVIDMPNSAVVLVNCYFSPDKDDFDQRLRAFVLSWLTEHRIIIVKSVKLFSFKHVGSTPGEQEQLDKYPKWTCGVSVNVDWPPDMPDITRQL